jgi:hypothetical protein
MSPADRRAAVEAALQASGAQLLAARPAVGGLLVD